MGLKSAIANLACELGQTDFDARANLLRMETALFYARPSAAAGDPDAVRSLRRVTDGSRLFLPDAEVVAVPAHGESVAARKASSKEDILPEPSLLASERDVFHSPETAGSPDDRTVNVLSTRVFGDQAESGS